MGIKKRLPCIFALTLFVTIIASACLIHDSINQQVDFTGAQVVQETQPLQSLEEVQQLYRNQKPKILKKNEEFLPASKSAYWIHWNMDLTGLEQPHYFFFTGPYLSLGQLFLRDAAGTIHEYKAGTQFPHTINGLYPSFQLEPHLGKVEAFLRVRAPFLLIFSAQLGTYSHYLKWSIQYVALIFFYIGIGFITVAYHLNWFATFRKKIYLRYIALVIPLCLTTLVGSGLVGVFLPGLESFLNEYIHIIRASCSITFLLFVYEFLEIGSESSRWKTWFDTLVWIAWIQFAFMLFSPEFSMIHDASNFMILASTIPAAFRARCKDKPGATQFLLAEILFGASVIIWTLGNYGLIQRNYWVIQSVVIGQIIEFIVFSTAVMKQIDTMIQEAEKGKRHQERLEVLQRFTRVLAHDLANPLSSLTLNIDTLSSIEPNEKDVLNELAHKMSRAANQMFQVINHARKIIALDSGKMQITLSPTSLAQAIEETQFAFQAKLNKKKIILEITHQDPKVQVLADPISLVNDVLNNLISNAIKFSIPGGKIRISTEITSSKQIQLMIADEGIGMPASLIEKVFDSSSATSRKGTQGEEGTGFGMPLVKQFVESYGAQIEIHSIEMKSNSKKQDTPQHGTRIRITFPSIRLA